MVFHKNGAKVSIHQYALAITSSLAIIASIFGLSSAHAHGGNEVLAGIVLDRGAEQRVRDQYRRPVQTLSFFHIEPGMKVAEALPGGGWYSQILAPYLGSEGQLHGINYNDSMWEMFGFFSPERIEAFQARTAEFSPMVAKFTNNGITTSGFTFDTAPESANGTLDRVLFIRALHNLYRFEKTAGTLSEALAVAYNLLKEDGLVGVVQHRVDESHSDASSDGSRGYLKQTNVIQAFEKAGFELLMSSELNANAKDQPSEADIVWRLPPSFNGVGDDETKRKAMQDIGESDRMTLLFKKKGASITH